MKKQSVLTDAIRKGDIRAAARLMRDIEGNRPESRARVAELLPYTGHAHIVGITGAPGTGKSTLLDRLIFSLRQSGRSVGVVLIDPTSPFSGGAILGDRLRMQRHATDSGVFIRSLATRGRLGGLSDTTGDIVTVMDAMGKAVILVETVGTGQDETDISALAHTTIVVTIPGMGDGVQLIKAGILESGDIFVVNKSDHPESESVAGQLAAMLDMRAATGCNWHPPVIRCAPLYDQGIADLLDQIDRHRDYLGVDDRRFRRQPVIERRFNQLLGERLVQEIHTHPSYHRRLADLIDAVKRGETGLQRAVDTVVSEILNAHDNGPKDNALP